MKKQIIEKLKKIFDAEVSDLYDRFTLLIPHVVAHKDYIKNMCNPETVAPRLITILTKTIENTTEQFGIQKFNLSLDNSSNRYSVVVLDIEITEKSGLYLSKRETVRRFVEKQIEQLSSENGAAEFRTKIVVY